MCAAGAMEAPVRAVSGQSAICAFPLKENCLPHLRLAGTMVEATQAIRFVPFAVNLSRRQLKRNFEFLPARACTPRR